MVLSSAGRCSGSTPPQSAGTGRPVELSGINVVGTVWILYILAGLLSSLGGIARTSYLSMGDPGTGNGMELDAIIAILLGAPPSPAARAPSSRPWWAR